MSHAAVTSGKQHRISLLQSAGDIIGVIILPANHTDILMGKIETLPNGAVLMAPCGLKRRPVHHRMTGDERRQMHLQMRYIVADIVQMDLPAVLVDNLARITDGFFIDTMDRGVGRRNARQLLACLLGLGAQIVRISVAILIADLIADHHGD
ncbi:MAG: hypothetical protein GPOALKHO_001904 [Sodalis sp.]|nr:MAG: hypothetical protein GPOALKHO_001904 [Sodalis sp.]